MIAFLDTESTALVEHPSMLSIGLVTSNDEEFYAEVLDGDRRRASSPFASNVVVPQLGRVAGAACDESELGARLVEFLDGLTAALPAGESVTVAYESDRDWALLERAIVQTHPERWACLKAALQPVNVDNMQGFAAGTRAAARYFDSQRFALFSRHHALCDARALRVAYDAATGWNAGHPTPVPATPEPSLHRPSADHRHLAATL